MLRKLFHVVVKLHLICSALGLSWAEAVNRVLETCMKIRSQHSLSLATSSVVRMLVLTTKGQYLEVHLCCY